MEGAPDRAPAPQRLPGAVQAIIPLSGSPAGLLERLAWDGRRQRVVSLSFRQAKARRVGRLFHLQGHPPVPVHPPCLSIPRNCPGVLGRKNPIGTEAASFLCLQALCLYISFALLSLHSRVSVRFPLLIFLLYMDSGLLSRRFFLL